MTQTLYAGRENFQTVLSTENMATKSGRKEYQEVLEAEMDATHEQERNLNFTMLDSVFREWCDQVTYNPRGTLSGKLHETYTHLSIPYRSSMSSFADEYGNWNKILLASNGFEYCHHPGKSVTLGDLKGHWVLMSEYYLSRLPSVIHYAKTWCGKEVKFVAFYNKIKNITVVKCKGVINLMIVFENREPYTETGDMYSVQ
jgi:hypothetical protein